MRKPFGLLLSIEEKQVFSNAAKIDRTSMNEWVRAACCAYIGIEPDPAGLVKMHNMMAAAIETTPDANAATVRMAMELAIEKQQEADATKKVIRETQEREQLDNSMFRHREREHERQFEEQERNKRLDNPNLNWR